MNGLAENVGVGIIRTGVSAKQHERLLKMWHRNKKIPPKAGGKGNVVLQSLAKILLHKYYISFP